MTIRFKFNCRQDSWSKESSFCRGSTDRSCRLPGDLAWIDRSGEVPLTEAPAEVCATVAEILCGGGWMKMFARLAMALIGAGVAYGGAARAQKPPLLPEKDVAALANELSGETAKRNLEGIARFHRQRGSQGFHAAAELVAERLRAYGLSDVAILQFPADGKIFYGTQRSRPAWDA